MAEDLVAEPFRFWVLTFASQCRRGSTDCHHHQGVRGLVSAARLVVRRWRENKVTVRLSFYELSVSEDRLADFKKYLRGVATMGDQTTTRPASLLAVRRFLSLVDVAGENTDWISVLCAIYKQDLAPAMFALPLLNHVYGWSQTMCTALDHFCTCYQHKAAAQD